MSAYSSSKVPAASDLLNLLLFLGRQKGPVKARVIWETLNIPRSSLYHLLNVAEEFGFVRHFPEERRYGLGPSAAELSQGFARQDSFSRIAAPVLARLVDETNENGHISTLNGRELIYLLLDRATGRRSIVTTEGVKLLAHETASGRSMLAYLPEDQLKATYSNFDFGDAGLSEAKGESGHRATNAFTNLRELRQRLSVVRSRGYEIELSEVTEGMASVAVPVKDQNGRPTAAMTITFKESPNVGPKVTRLAKVLARHAAMLERRIAI